MPSLTRYPSSVDDRLQYNVRLMATSSGLRIWSTARLTAPWPALQAMTAPGAASSMKRSSIIIRWWGPWAVGPPPADQGLYGGTQVGKIF